MKPILLEIVTHTVSTFAHCSSCSIVYDEAGIKDHWEKELEEYPRDLKEEFLHLLDWIRELTRLYRHRLTIRLIDAQSFLGMYKSLRYRIRKYPAFIVQKKEAFSGWEKDRLEALLDKHVKAFVLSRREGKALP